MNKYCILDVYELNTVIFMRFHAILKSLCFAATYKAVLGNLSNGGRYHTEIDINGRFDGPYPEQRARYGIV